MFESQQQPITAIKNPAASPCSRRAFNHSDNIQQTKTWQKKQIIATKQGVKSKKYEITLKKLAKPVDIR